MVISAAANTPSLDTALRPSAGTAVKKMEGMMWYNMLSEMNQNGFSSDALGTGGGAYQSMFLWDISQSDFDKYDAGLVSATLQQIGGRAVQPPAPVVKEFPPAMTGPAGEYALSAAGAGVLDAVALAHAKDLTRAIWPAIQTAASALGVPPVAVLAQAALETGWGNSVPGNNLFGIKAGAGQSSTAQMTHEMVDGAMVPTVASFRDYATPDSSVADYVRLIQSNFQTVVGQNSVAGFAYALQAGGFATDSNYAAKIITIAHSPMMGQMLQSVGVDAAPTD